MFKAEIILDSIDKRGNRITTFKVTYPRIIHAEMCRHRILSRNSASSRAIPFNKMLQMVTENPFIPIAWQKDHKGMQGSEYITDEFEIDEIRFHWINASKSAIHQAKNLNTLGLTKQLCNRLLEPFLWHTEIITGTEWENFFNIRCPKYQTPVSQTIEPQRSWKDLMANHSNESNLIMIEKMSIIEKLNFNNSQAEIHIQAIAELMWDAINDSVPQTIVDDWHIPFADNLEIPKLIDLAHNHITKNKPEYSPTAEELQSVVTELAIKIATARCARISYETLGDNPKIDYEADIKLHDRLLEQVPMSPFEHCAKAMSDKEYELFVKGKVQNWGGESSLYEYGHLITSLILDTQAGWCNNFKGFIQYRYLIENK